MEISLRSRKRSITLNKHTNGPTPRWVNGFLVAILLNLTVNAFGQKYVFVNVTPQQFSNLPKLLNSSQAWGDYDKDGRPDLMVIGQTQEKQYTSKLYRNTTDGFVDVSSLLPNLPGVANGAVVWGDYDNDGHLDLFLTGATDPNTGISKLYHGNGKGFDEVTKNVPVPAMNSSAAWGDYDKDGKLDLMLTGRAYDSTFLAYKPVSKLYHNDGNSFSERAENFPDLADGTVNWVDYDKDGWLDLMLTGHTRTGWDSKLYRNTHPGFQDQSTLLPNLPQVSNSAVSWADLNIDDRPDLVLTGQTSNGSLTSKLYLNGSSASFAEVNSLPDVQNSAIAWGDYDQDGRPDLFLSGDMGGGKYISRLYQNTTSGFVDRSSLLPDLPQVANGAASWADYDSDGKLDLILNGDQGGTNNYAFKLYHNTGNGFEDKTNLLNYLSSINVYDTQFPMAYGTINWVGNDKDNLPDLMLTGLGVVDNTAFQKTLKPTRLLYGNVSSFGEGKFKDISTEQAKSLPFVHHSAVASADFNHDGRMDLIITGSIDKDPYVTNNLVCQLFQNTADGYVDVSNLLPSTPGLWEGSVAWGDYDQDGWADLLITGFAVSQGISRLYRNNAGKNFEDKSSLLPQLPQLSQSSVAWGDYDSDGRVDLLVTGSGGPSSSQSVSKLYHNTGKGFEDASSTFPNLPQVANSAVSWVDYDNDGRLDLLLTGIALGKPVTKLYHNTGLLAFADASNQLPNLPGFGYGSIAIGDYDKDNRPDLLLTGNTNSGVISKLYHNTANGFDDSSVLLPQLGGIELTFDKSGVSNGSVAWIDYDRDGKLDLFFTGHTSLAVATSELFHNVNLDASNLLPGLPAVSDGSVAWGDYDNDGKLDLLMTGDTGSGLVSKLYHNKSTGFEDQSNLLPNLPQLSQGSVAWGDYDNDGKLDLLMTGDTGSGLVSKLYHNTGSGFVDVTGSQLPELPGLRNSSVAWGDYNSDGRLDLMLTGKAASKLISKLYRNTGKDFVDASGVLPNLPQLNSGSVNWADYDKDGRLDLLLTGFSVENSGAVYKLYHNTGDGFEDKTSLLPNLSGLYNSAVAWGDYNQDGWLDLFLCGNDKTHPVTRLYENEGGAAFMDVTSSKLPNIPQIEGGSVAWGDCNNDGRLDLFLCGYDPNAQSRVSKLYLNTITGFLDYTNNYLPDLPNVNGSVAWGDYDNDGRLDLMLTGNSNGASVSKLYHNPLFSVNTPPKAPSSLVSATDLNDLTVKLSWQPATDAQTPSAGLNYNLYVSDTPGGQNVVGPMADQRSGYRRVVQLGNSQTTGYTLTGLTPGKKYYWSVQAIDGAFAGSPFAPEQSFIMIPGFVDQPNLLAGMPAIGNSAVAWGDYDNDGKLDLMMMGKANNYSSVTRLYRNTGGGFEDKSSLFGNTLPQGILGTVTWADYNNDGRLDLFLTGHLEASNQNFSRLYQNTKTGFTDVTASSGLKDLPGLTYSTTVWGDYDKDGRVDLFITGGTGQGTTTRLYKNNPDGFIDVTPNLLKDLPGMWKSAAAWGDYNNDGRLDLFVSGLSDTMGAISRLYQNTSTGFMDVTRSLLLDIPQVKAGSVAWADYDNDGWLDLLLTGQTNADTANVIRLYHNNTGNGFSDGSSLLPNLPGLNPGSVIWGDYDNNGWLDLLLTGQTNADTVNVIWLYHNTGSGFEDLSSLLPNLPGVAKGAVVWGDYDNDGRLDLLMTGFSPSPTSNQSVNRLYHNQSLVVNTPPVAPNGLSRQVLSDSTSIKLNWKIATDAQTPSPGLNYNLYVSDTPGGQNVVGPMADQRSGYRRVVQLGNSQTTGYTLTGLTPGKKYYWSVQAIDGAFAGSPFAPEQSFTTALQSDPEQVLKLVSPSYNCQTGAFMFQTTGGDGSPIEYNAPGITAWTSNPRQYVDTELRTAADAQPITLVARQSGQEVRYVFDLRAICPVGDPNQFRLVAPFYNCQTGSFSFRTQGGDESPIEYNAPGITSWTKNPNQLVDFELRQAADAQPITLVARQSGKQVRYLWDIRAICPVDQPGLGLGSPQSQSFEDVSSLLSGMPAVQAPSVVWGDYDNDGKLDLMITGKADVPLSKLYHNTGTGFEEQSSLLPGLPQVSSSSVAWADYDNDGRLDLLLTGMTANNAPVSKLYHNTANGFEDQTSLIPDQPQVGNGAVAFGDYDNDGRADFILTGRSPSGSFSKLYRNTGNGFEDKTDLLPGLPALQLSAVAFGDYDNDGKLDLMVTGIAQSNSTPYVSKLYHNTGSGFEEASDQLPELVGLAAGSVTWNDFDNDGRLDLLLTGTNGGTRYTTRLYHNTDYGFENASRFSGFYLGSAAWGDYDNDGLKDLLFMGVTTAGYSSKLYRNTGRGFTDASDQLPGLPSMGYSAAGWADYDNDGKLDVLMTGFTSSGNALKLYHNISPVANTPPTRPSELISRTSTSAVQLVWDLSTDAQTSQAGLNYNVYISDTPGDVNTFSPMANISTGYRRVVQLGNSQTPTITLKGLQPNKTYYWSVQAIDGVFAGSPFAPEQTFTISGAARVGVGPEPGVGLRAEIYPNPVESELTVRLEGVQNQSVDLQLMDLNGQPIHMRKLDKTQSVHRERLSVESLPSGLYLLRVSSGQQNVTLKVVKQ